MVAAATAAAAAERQVRDAAAATEESAAVAQAAQVEQAKQAGNVQAMGFGTLKAYLIAQGFPQERVKVCTSKPQLLHLHGER